MAVLNGLFSRPGRLSEFAISELKERCEGLCPDIYPKPAASPSRSPERSPKRRQKVPSQADTADESLVGAILAKLRMNLAAGRNDEEKDDVSRSLEESSQRVGKAKLTPSFTSLGFYDGVWASKFTAAASPGALNRWNEQRPDPVWYKVQHGEVLCREPHWDFIERKHKSRMELREKLYLEQRGEKSRAPSPDDRGSAAGKRRARSAEDNERSTGHGTFLTSVDLSPGHASRPRSAKQLQLLQPMALQSPRPDLGKIGRVHVLMHEVTAPADDLLEQDIRAYPKLRYPEWDFVKQQGRKPLIKPDNIMDPGRYDVSFSQVQGKIKSGPKFEKVLPRSASLLSLGHGMPPAVLHPEDKRSPGGVILDRSKAKDWVAHRITNVNDFLKEMPRPPLPAAAHEYHRKGDPLACELVLERQLQYNANQADKYVTHRRDITIDYDRMLPRGAAAVRGNRFCASDPAILGSVGIGFVQISGLDGNIEKPGVRPPVAIVFDKTPQFQPTLNHNNFNHGHAPVQGDGPYFQQKQSSLNRDRGRRPSGGFQRKASGVGFLPRHHKPAETSTPTSKQKKEATKAASDFLGSGRLSLNSLS